MHRKILSPIITILIYTIIFSCILIGVAQLPARLAVGISFILASFMNILLSIYGELYRMNNRVDNNKNGKQLLTD